MYNASSGLSVLFEPEPALLIGQAAARALSHCTERVSDGGRCYRGRRTDRFEGRRGRSASTREEGLRRALRRGRRECGKETNKARGGRTQCAGEAWQAAGTGNSGARQRRTAGEASTTGFAFLVVGATRRADRATAGGGC
ncbi:hypothetical protein MRX96_003905 [Rhipicephalus microplus]